MTEADSGFNLRELCWKACQGDLTAFESLIAFLKPLLEKHFRQVCFRQSDCDDCFQEFSFKLWEKKLVCKFPDEARNDAHLLNLILLSSRLSVVDLFRSKPYKMRAFEKPLSSTPEQVTSQLPENSLIVLDLFQALCRRLPPKDRKVLEFYLDGYSQSEIAKLLDCTVGTIKASYRKIQDLISKMRNDGKL